MKNILMLWMIYQVGTGKAILVVIGLKEKVKVGILLTLSFWKNSDD
jgi:hypothetical protein